MIKTHFVFIENICHHIKTLKLGQCCTFKRISENQNCGKSFGIVLKQDVLVSFICTAYYAAGKSKEAYQI